MQIIAILNRKGGVGKTATVHALGAALMQRKKKVLFIDADGQSNLTLSLNAREDAKGLSDVFHEKCTIKEAIQKTEGGYIIPGNEELQTLDVTLVVEKKANYLKQALKDLDNMFDYCIIDTPAALGMITINCLAAADKVIIPAQADIYSVQGLNRLLGTIQDLKTLKGIDVNVSGVLLTRFNPRTVISKQLSEDLEGLTRHYKTKVFKARIPECNAIREAAMMQEDIFSYAPGSKAAEEYMNFVNEFLKTK